LLSALLLLVGACFGGLHTLLRSPLRSGLLGELPTRARDRAEALFQQTGAVASSALLIKLICVFSAGAWAAAKLVSLEEGPRWGELAVLAVFGAFVLEGIPALVRRGKLLRLPLAVAPVAQLLARPIQPILNALGWSTQQQQLAPLNEDQRFRHRASQLVELAHQHAATEHLGSSELKMIGRLLELPETDTAEVMTPRTSVTAVSSETPIAEAMELATEEGHSRLPVFGKDLDHVQGVFHVKDALPLVGEGAGAAEAAVRLHMRPVLTVPETMRVPALLELMRREQVHLALVVDEYGGTSGVVSIEDLLEQIVGDIQDEHDTIADQPQVHHSNDDEIVVDGNYGVDELNERYGTDLPEDDAYETLAGLLFMRLGSVPPVGATVELESASLEVLEADDRRIHKVRLLRHDGREPSTEATQTATETPDAA